MDQKNAFNPEARCLTCEYLLRGLPESVCPECGRAFDPSDPSSYQIRPPHWRRRWWIKRGVAAFLVIFFLALFFPRKLLTGRITFTCPKCSESLRVSRYEPRPPRWIPFRYPGITWRSNLLSASPANTRCVTHPYNFKVKFDLFIGGWASGTGTIQTAQPTTINGMVLTTSSADDVLKASMHPANNGIGP